MSRLDDGGFAYRHAAALDTVRGVRAQVLANRAERDVAEALPRPRPPTWLPKVPTSVPPEPERR